jgi:hypothetical protein
MISDLNRLFRQFYCPGCRVQAYGHVMGYETVRDRVFRPCSACEDLIKRTVRGEITPEIEEWYPFSEIPM